MKTTGIKRDRKISASPAREPHRVGKPLERELSGLFGARRGHYGLRYRIDDEAQRVHIVHIGHHTDVYRSR